MHPINDHSPALGRAILARRGEHAPDMGFVGAAGLTEQAECVIHGLENETGPPL